MSKTISAGFTAHRGGVNAIVPVIKRLMEDKELSVKLFGHKASVDAFQEEKLPFSTLRNYKVADISQDSIKKVLEDEQPDLVLTGTGFQRTESEMYTIDQTTRVAAKKLRIPTIAVCDSWAEEEWRFTDRYDIVGPKYLADKITALDETSKERLMRLGNIPEDRIVITGNPHFKTFQDFGKEFTLEQRAEVRKQLKVPENAYLVLQSTDVDADLKSNNWGFTNADVTETICKGLGNAHLYIRRHPGETNDEAFNDCVETAKKSGVNYTVEPFKNGKFAVAASDMVVGAASTVMIEALLMDKQAVGLQPGRNSEEDEFVLHKNKFIPFSYDKTRGGYIIKDLIEGNGTATKTAKEGMKAFNRSTIANGQALLNITDIVYSILKKK